MPVRISIVTICFNNLSDLQRTCASVDVQNVQPFEHLLIDGSITEDIYNWLTTTAQPLYRKWVHERDSGIADAFNKGITNASGEVFHLLNAGDEMYDPTVLQRIVDLFSNAPKLMWCHGKMLRFRGNIWLISGKRFSKEKLHRGMQTVFHPTMYVRKEVYDRRGLFDINLKVAMDYDFLCRIADEPFYFVNYPLARYDPNGISNTHFLTGINESNSRYKKYFGTSLKQKLWYWLQWGLSNLLNTELGKWLYRLKIKLGGNNW